MEQSHKIDVRLSHRVDVGGAAKYLLGELNCDDGYVASQHEHLFVVQLSKGGNHKYAVRFECTSPVEKAIYHGGKAWSLSFIPLEDENQLPPGKIAAIKSGLEKLE